MEYFLDKDTNEEINPYDFLDAALDMLVNKKMVDDNGKILNATAQKIIDDIIQKQLLYKIKSKVK
jgi:hypothetical protein